MKQTPVKCLPSSTCLVGKLDGHSSVCQLNSRWRQLYFLLKLFEAPLCFILLSADVIMSGPGCDNAEDAPKESKTYGK